MLEVELDRILPLTEVRDKLSKIIEELEQGGIYVLTKNGKPAVVMVNVNYLEELTGQKIQSKKVETPTEPPAPQPPISPAPPLESPPPANNQSTENNPPSEIPTAPPDIPIAPNNPPAPPSPPAA